MKNFASMGISLAAVIVIGALLGRLSIVVRIVASPASHLVVHEKRFDLPAGWSKIHKLEGTFVLPVRIGLTQQNLHRGEEFLKDVSDPSSPRFGQHWTAKLVAETFAPSADTVSAVKEWLTYAGISPDRVSQSQSLNWLIFNATADEAEGLLQTKYHVYQHERGHTHIACEDYSIPASIREHVDFVMPTVQFDRKIVGDWGRKQNLMRDQPIAAIAEHRSDFVTKRANLDIHGILDCDEYITPKCLRALYEFPPGDSEVQGNRYGIVEYRNWYLQHDLDLFFRNFTSTPLGTAPILESIDGGFDQTTNQSLGKNVEADLDLQFGMALVYPQKVTLFQVGDLVQGLSFNNFLDAIDGSYCTYEGGNNATVDGVYPDPNSGGYKGPLNCGGFAATNVISTSYALPELYFTPFYIQRQCHEYMKLGLQGVTILYASGDGGVAHKGDVCIDPVTKKFINGSRAGLFNPDFPGTCPYVTAVGATQIKPGASVRDPEVASETFPSGGGFSNVFPIPWYQESAVQSWFKNHPPPYGADRFNNSQATRGFPDVSANGVKYQVAVDGVFGRVSGTSASTPVFGALITLINEKRLALGKSPVGFLNPTLYANPETLHDITHGQNPGCGTAGFNATTGWDPVTGLGTPNYPALLALYLSLP